MSNIKNSIIFAAKAAMGICIFVSSGYAQSVFSSSVGCNPTTNVCTITLGGSYILNASTNNIINITASNVTLDLGGYSITGGTTCTNSSTTHATTCNTGASNGTSMIRVTGYNVTIKNGYVVGSPGIGLFAQTLISNINQNIVIKDVTFSDNAGGAIWADGNGVTLLNVNASKNGATGIWLNTSNVLDHVNSSYNNGDGILVTNAVMTNIVATGNYNFGIETNGGLSGGSLTNVNATTNFYGGVKGQSLAIVAGSFGSNQGLGLQTVGGVTSTIAAGGNNGSQTAAQYFFDPYSCYLNVTSSLGTITGTGKNGSGLTGCQ